MKNIKSSYNCLVINEASSTQTSVFIFKVASWNLGIEKIYSLAYPNVRLDEYVEEFAPNRFYSDIVNNEKLKSFLLNSSCLNFHWALLATGGMRNFEDNKGFIKSNIFYYRYKSFFPAELCENATCKNISLYAARTISGEEEAYFAWNSFDSDNNCHAVFDLGGQTYQFSNSSLTTSAYLGKERAILYLKTQLKFCYYGHYNGELCRANIRNYFMSQEVEGLNLEHKNNCKSIGISNFFHYFSELCGLYLPFINSSIDNSLNDFYRIEELCDKKSFANSFAVYVEDYKNMSDLSCEYWNDDWNASASSHTYHACFTANYNYELLKFLNIEDSHILHLSNEGWELGAAKHYVQEIFD